MEKVRIGIVGCGNMGKGHAGYILDGKIENAYLSAVCDIDPERLQYYKDTYPDSVKCFSDAEEMFKSGECDLVMIETPHYSHPELAIKALDCGLHCIVDKPAGVYTLQVKEMIKRAESSDKVLGIMFNQRTNPVFKKMREIILSGELGDIKRTNWIITDWYRTQFYYDCSPWRATWIGEGGGVLYNQAPHQLDLFQWIIGMSPCKVRAYCHIGKWHDIEVEDDVTCYCEYPNGATGVFVTTTADYPGTNRFEVTGTLGTLIYEGGKLTLTKLTVDEREHCKNCQTSFKTPDIAERIEVVIEGDNPQHRGITSNVVNTILGKEELYAPAKDGLNGVMLANAMMLSSWLNTEVSLPFDDELFYEELKKRIATSSFREVKKSEVVSQA